MDKVKKLWNKASTWFNKEVEYTNGDALLLLFVVVHTILFG